MNYPVQKLANNEFAGAFGAPAFGARTDLVLLLQFYDMMTQRTDQKSPQIQGLAVLAHSLLLQSGVR
ncbi:MAG: hypothetical protein GY938_06880 [Ketobacter sp.]|nr:hypothetical protein [Ketobacter sp.]